MSTVYKWLVAALLSALVAGGLWGGYTHIQLAQARAEAAQARQEASGYLALADARKAALEAAEARHKATISSINRRTATAEKQAKQYKEKHDALSKALDDDRGWADSPIPAGVAAALGRTAGGR